MAETPRVGQRHRLRSLAVVLLLAVAVGTLAPQASAAPFAYVTDSGDGDAVTVVDTATNSVVTTVPVGFDPWGIAVSVAISRAYVAMNGSPSAVVIDTATNTVVTSVTLPDRAFHVALDPTGARAYLSLVSGSVAVVDTATNTVVTTIATSNAYHLAVHPAGSRLYVTNPSGGVTVVDTTTNTVVTTIPLAGSYGLVFNGSGTRLYVTSSSPGDGISIVDPASNTIIGTIHVPLGPDGSLTINPSGTRLYQLQGTQVAVIDTATNTVIATPDAGLNSLGLAATDSRLYVVNGCADMSCVTGALTVIDGATNTLVTTVPAGFQAREIALGVAPPTPCAPIALSRCKAKVRYRHRATAFDGFSVTCDATVAPQSDGINPARDGLRFTLNNSAAQPECFSQTMATPRLGKCWTFKPTNRTDPGIRLLKVCDRKPAIGLYRLTVSASRADLQCLYPAPLIVGLTTGTNCATCAIAPDGTCGPPPVCGNGVIEPGEDCDAGANNDSTSSCCGTTCHFRPSGSVCRSAVVGGCDVAEVCDGHSADCPVDAVAPSGTVCRPSNGQSCDPAETCTGSSTACPADVNNCTCGNGIVDPGEQCDEGASNGSAGSCCTAGVVGVGCLYRPTGTVCRSQNGACDVPETCTGTTGQCPSDSFVPFGTTCPDDGNICTDDHCNGAGSCIHPNNTASCDDGVFCNGADTCSGGSCSGHSGNPCSGGPVCNNQCNEAARNCFTSAGVICRPSNGQSCDPAETCTGSSTACPADVNNCVTLVTATVPAAVGASTTPSCPSPSGCTYSVGASASVSAPTPVVGQGTTGSSYNPDHFFDHWTGDATGTSNPLQVPMDRDKQITANYFCLEHEPNNRSLEQTNVYGTGGECAGNVYGVISSGTDADWFCEGDFVPAGKTISVYLIPPADKDYDVELYDSVALQLVAASYNRGAGAFETITYTTLTSSAYSVRVIGHAGDFSASETYLMSYSRTP